MGGARTHLRIGAAALGAALAACTNTVVPPEPRGPTAAAFLLDHGRHASLVVEHEAGLNRYAYGQWQWYVENRKGPARASGTLVSSGPAGLGRARLAGPPAIATVRREVEVPIEAGWRIDVPADRAAALTARLEALFRERADTRTHNPRYGLDFVRHPNPYSLGHNSNHVAGQWLRALGCRVDMGGPFSVWRVARPAAAFP